LALSSRNAYLDDRERQAATILNRALMQARDAYNEGEHSASRLIEIVRSAIATEPLARIDYVNINDIESLAEIDRVDDRAALLSLAVFIGKTRLIDNVVLGRAEKNVIGANA